VQRDECDQKEESDGHSYGALPCGGRLDAQHDRRKTVNEAMDNHQSDMMDGKRQKRDQP
jgi:hypothetical protein